jgi:hypothetical protein
MEEKITDTAQIAYLNTAYYYKSFLNDLQRTWLAFRQAVIKLPASDFKTCLLFHVDEGMRWEHVQDLDAMGHNIVLLENLVRRDVAADTVMDNALDEAMEWLSYVRLLFDEVVRCLAAMKD